MSENQIIQTIRRDKALERLWNRMNADQKRRVLEIETDDLCLAETLKEILELGTEREEAQFHLTICNETTCANRAHHQ